MTEGLTPPPLSYLSEQPQDWARQLRAARTLTELRRLTEVWHDWVPDAEAAAAKMTPAQFTEFHRGLMARSSARHWAERYGRIAIPQRLLEISLIASRYHVPFGTAAIRAYELKPERFRWLKQLLP